MLQQNFMAAEQLYLTEQEYSALKTTLVMLETGKMTHVGFGLNRYRGLSFGFNMAEWAYEVIACGTVRCIGGTAEFVGHFSGFANKARLLKYHGHDGLYDLFFCECRGERYMQSVTTEIAACALRNYLRTGKPEWPEL